MEALTRAEFEIIWLSNWHYAQESREEREERGSFAEVRLNLIRLDPFP